MFLAQNLKTLQKNFQQLQFNVQWIFSSFHYALQSQHRTSKSTNHLTPSVQIQREKDVNFFRSKIKRSFWTVKKKKRKKERKKSHLQQSEKNVLFHHKYGSRKRKRKIFSKMNLKKPKTQQQVLTFIFQSFFPGKMNKCSGPVVGSTSLLTRFFSKKKLPTT